VTGQIQSDGSSCGSVGRVWLLAESSVPSRELSATWSGEQFRIDGIPAGRYRVQAELDPPCYLKEVRAGETLLADRMIDLARPMRLQLVVSDRAGTVAGNILSPGVGTPLPRFVSLTPSGDSESSSLTRIEPVDVNGSFKFNPVIPGEYVLSTVGGPGSQAITWDLIRSGSKKTALAAPRRSR
jgi:hypothetical protein